MAMIAREDEIVVLVHDTGISWVDQAAQAVRAAGCRAGLVTGAGAGPDLARLAALVDRAEVVDDPTDPGSVAGAARRLATDHRLGAVISGNDGCVVAAARAAELLGLRRAPARSVALSRNKYAAREVLRRAGLPGPRYALLRDDSAAPAVAAEVGLPAVVKPVNGTGSHLVLPVDTVPELAEAYRMMAERLPAADTGRLYRRPLDGPDGGAAGGIDPGRVFLVESRLCGREFCADLIVRDGVVEQLALVDKVLVDGRFFERGFVLPPFDLPPARAERIRRTIAAAVRAIGLENSVAHVEVIDDAEVGPAIVEVNAGRPGGPSLHTLYRLTAGIDTVAELVAVSRGVPARRTRPTLPTPLASLTVFAEESGRLRAIHGIEELEAHPDVLRVVPVRRPGDLISNEREMHVVLAVVAGFLDRDDLVETYGEVDGAIRLEFDLPDNPAGVTGPETGGAPAPPAARQEGIYA
jgi:biotin carboxylase